MGSKKWWSRQHLLRFGIQVCDLTEGQAKRLFDECEAGLSELKAYVQERLTGPLGEDQNNVLIHLNQLLGSDPDTFDPVKCTGV
jgi:serine/threonine-protein kinase HipA